MCIYLFLCNEIHMYITHSILEESLTLQDLQICLVGPAWDLHWGCSVAVIRNHPRRCLPEQGRPMTVIPLISTWSLQITPITSGYTTTRSRVSKTVSFVSQVANIFHQCLTCEDACGDLVLVSSL
jgi:hypothetical protein